MREVIQLLYSNECTRDQHPFNGQMRAGTTLVNNNTESVHQEEQLATRINTVFTFILRSDGFNAISHTGSKFRTQTTSAASECMASL